MDVRLLLLLTLMAAFAGGAISTAIAELLRGIYVARRERKHLLAELFQDASSWLNSTEDLFTKPRTSLAGAPIEIPSLYRVLTGNCFSRERDAELREQVRSVLRAANMYNAKLEFASQRQAQDWHTGKNLRAEAATYAKQTLIPKLEKLRSIVQKHRSFRIGKGVDTTY